MAFVVWGPFADNGKRLRTVLINGLQQNEVKSRAEMRKMKKKEKVNERTADTVNKCGLTTDQMISLQAVQVQRDKLKTQKYEVEIANLMMMQNTIINDQITQYERQAERMCPTNNEANVHWKRVDNLYSQQQELLTSVDNLRLQLSNESTENEFNNSTNNDVIDISSEVGGVTQEDTASHLTSQTLKVPVKVTTGTTTSKSPYSSTSHHTIIIC